MKTMIFSAAMGLSLAAGQFCSQAGAADRNDAAGVPAMFADLNAARTATVTFVDHEGVRWHNGRWWYQRPNSTWCYHHDGAWHDYQPGVRVRSYSYRPYSSDYNYGYRGGRSYGNYGYGGGYGNYDRGHYGHDHYDHNDHGHHDHYDHHDHHGGHSGGHVDIGGFHIDF